jgi:hypothetical protein
VRTRSLITSNIHTSTHEGRTRCCNDHMHIPIVPFMVDSPLTRIVKRAVIAQKRQYCTSTPLDCPHDCPRDCSHESHSVYSIYPKVSSQTKSRSKHRLLPVAVGVTSLVQGQNRLEDFGKHHHDLEDEYEGQDQNDDCPSTFTKLKEMQRRKRRRTRKKRQRYDGS